MSDLFGGLTPTFAPRHVEVPAQDTNNWFTPMPLWRRLDAAYDFALDVCGHELAPVTQAILAKPGCDAFRLPDDDALRLPWCGMCWLNPEYSTDELTLMFERLWSQLTSYQPIGIVALLPAKKTEQSWWHRFVEPWRDSSKLIANQWTCTTRNLQGRLTFGHPGDPTGAKADQAMFPSVLVSYQYVGFNDPLRTLDLEGL